MTGCCGTDVTVFGHTSRDCPSTMVPPRDMNRRANWQTDPLRVEPTAIPTPVDPIIGLIRAAREYHTAPEHATPQPPVHHIPEPGRSLTPCCGRPLHMLDGKITAEPRDVTCTKAS